MRYLLYVIFIAIPIIGFSQVGINTHTPTATLDVQGNARIDGSIFLENPATNNNVVNPTLLIKLVNGNIVTYDIDISRYGPINFSQFIFREVATNGLQDFDTQIDITKYTVTIQGFFFLSNNNNAQGGFVLGRNPSDQNSMEGYQFYAYQNSSTGTWWIRAILNNSTFTAQAGGFPYVNSSVDLFINTLIYRNEFITTSLDTPITVDMGGLETGVAPLPPGF